ncbi:MAG: M20 family metallopeptidase [Saprospiraceae bacterium]|nr:M20 family metallopeptidase [Saprospiraceae bacterium]
MTLVSAIQELAQKYYADTVALRRYLHQFPELSYHEYKTQAFISETLTNYGIPHTYIAQTGVLALVESALNPHKKTTALRSDHDALPIVEANDVPYKSKNKGVMHACGHDAHTAMNLTAARILWKLRDKFEGTVKFLYQPAEEFVKPDGTSGADMMIEDGALVSPSPHSIIAQHVNPSLDFGKIALKSGNIMASVDTIKIRVMGKGGHGAQPHLCVDPVVVGCHIVLALQNIVARRANPMDATVLSIGRIAGGVAFNVIPQEVELLGTLRAYNETWRYEAHDHIQRIAMSVAHAFGATADCVIERGIPYLPNDEAVTDRIKKAAIDYLGEENVLPIEAAMTGEDFAVYAQKMPACFYWLGVRNEKEGITSGLHANTMTIDEHALALGSGLMAYLGVNELSYEL